VGVERSRPSSVPHEPAPSRQPYALDAYRGEMPVFEFRGPADPPSGTVTTLGNVHLLHVVAPVAPGKAGR
jgi:hypothetical protein